MNISTPVTPQLLFGAGQVRLFSDFDGTYLPAAHKTISQAKGVQELPTLERYFGQVKKFLDQGRPGFRLTLTTGRNLGEFHSIVNHFRRIGLKVPLPDTVIVKNGADEYIKTVADPEFYHSGHPPYTRANENKRSAIQNATGWNGPLIREKIIRCLEEQGFHIRQDPTTNSAEDYGKDSTLHYVHDHYDRDGSDSPWVSALRQDGDLKFFIGLPKEMQHYGKDHRQSPASILEKLEQELNTICKQTDGHPHFSIRYQAKDPEYGNHPSITITPRIKGDELTKVYDTHQAVMEAIRNHDLVITAGDGGNDFEMLNPARYLQLPEHLKNIPKRDLDQPEMFLNMLRQNPDLKKKFEALPFAGIVIERNNSLPHKLQQLVDAYGNGPHPKIFKVQEGHLFEGVMDAIRRYEKTHPNFSSSMDPNLKNALSEFQRTGFFNVSLPVAGKPLKSSFIERIREKFEGLKNKIKAYWSGFMRWLGRPRSWLKIGFPSGKRTHPG